MRSVTISIPAGRCQCGCGEETRLASQSSARNGWIAGQPLRYVHGHHRRLSGVPFTVEDRGYSTPCHMWARTRSVGGYGRTAEGPRRSVAAHVVYYERAHGPIADGLELDHLCGQRACVNVDHLEAVTHAENVRRGKLTKLTALQIVAIRAVPRSRGSGRALAVEFGVSPTTISDIRNGKTWAQQPDNV